MQTIKIIIYVVLAVILTTFVWRNVDNSVNEIDFLFWQIKDVNLMVIMVIMLLSGVVLMLPLFLRNRISKKRKEKIQLEKEETKNLNSELPTDFFEPEPSPDKSDNNDKIL